MTVNDRVIVCLDDSGEEFHGRVTRLYDGQGPRVVVSFDPGTKMRNGTRIFDTDTHVDAVRLAAKEISMEFLHEVPIEDTERRRRVDASWRSHFDAMAEELGRRDFTLVTTTKGTSLSLPDGWKTGPATWDVIVDRVKRASAPGVTALGRTCIALGWEDEKEMMRHVSSLDLSYGYMDDFTIWKNEDGSKEGLLALKIPRRDVAP